MLLFGKSTKVLWSALVLAAVVFEVIPTHYPAAMFAVHNYWKAGLFLLLGFLAPLAFWRSKNLNTSILLSIGSAVLVEVTQAILADGHRFSLMELAIKLLLLGAGFAIALGVRIWLTDHAH